MKIYRVSLWSDSGDGSTGYSYHSSKREAEKAARENRSAKSNDSPDPDVEVIDVSPTRAGIIKVLNRYGGHPDNG